MTHGVEEAVTAVLRERAEDEVDARAVLDGALARGRRRKRARRAAQMIGATASVAALAVVGGVVATGMGQRDLQYGAPYASSGWSGTVPDLAGGDSPEEVWPEAVHRLPATLPDGRGYQVYAVLGGDRYLVRTDAEVSAPLVFDAKSGDLVFLGTEEMRARPGWSTRDWTVAVGDHAVWFASVPEDNGQRWHAEIWTARLDGTGGPKKIATVPDHGHDPTNIGVLGDGLYWGPNVMGDRAGSGVTRVPVTGGAPRPVPDSDGFLLFGLSPWTDTTSHYVAEGESTPRRGVLWNVETGERRPWVAHGAAEQLVCHPEICAGTTGEGRHFLQRLDGTGVRELPYPKDGFDLRPAVGGRFGVGTVKTSRGYVWYAWDLTDDTVASIRAGEAGATGSDGEGYYGFERSILQWRAPDGAVRVLDLAAIG